MLKKLLVFTSNAESAAVRSEARTLLENVFLVRRALAELCGCMRAISASPPLQSDGLAAASLLQAEIVTADGKVLIANACTNPDLFWALKGGGGGSFGVVTKVTLATYELPAFFGRVQGLIKSNSLDAFALAIVAGGNPQTSLGLPGNEPDLGRRSQGGSRHQGLCRWPACGRANR